MFHAQTQYNGNVWMSALSKKCSNPPAEHKTRGALLFEQAGFDWHRFPKIFLIKITNSKSETSCWADISDIKLGRILAFYLLIFVRIVWFCLCYNNLMLSTTNDGEDFLLSKWHVGCGYKLKDNRRKKDNWPLSQN